ncbi:MAG TPA: ABC transporter ATP-binding protein [Burkholderiales bacterium]|nr:ABC transporter ATP-binding protein [Burkholderiales bacterium]
MALLHLQGLRKSFGSVEVLHGIDAEVSAREFAVLVGPSGSGKTTLLRLVAGLEQPTHGWVRLDGRMLNGLAPKDRDMAMVFQQYALYPHMTVRENLGFSLRMRNEPRARIATRVDQVAELLGLRALLERRPNELSGGQQQRVAIGRAIVRQPRVFLFDEPLSSLEGSLRAQMRAELKALHRRIGTTSLYVTHDQTEAMALADRLIVLRDGRVEQAGTPLEIYEHPANLFVAGFIGVPAMNFVRGRVAGGQLHAAGGIRLPLQDRRAAEGAELVYGFRPEACTLGAGAPARLITMEHLGGVVQLFVRMGEAQVCIVTSQRAAWQIGEQVRVSPDPARVHLFDPASGAALPQ